MKTITEYCYDNLNEKDLVLESKISDYYDKFLKDRLKGIKTIIEKSLKMAGKSVAIKILNLYYIATSPDVPLDDKLYAVTALLSLIGEENENVRNKEVSRIVDHTIELIKKHTTPEIIAKSEAKFNEWFGDKNKE